MFYYTFFTLHTAYAKLWTSGLVAAPFIKREWLKRLVVPHNNLMPVCFCRLSTSSTISSKFLFVSSKVSPSGERSTSWKQKYSTPNLVKNSNAAWALSLALSSADSCTFHDLVCMIFLYCEIKRKQVKLLFYLLIN